MKRTHKKVLGLFCLGLVAVMTIFAALLPVPETQATASVTDTIQVRVVGSVPDVNMSGIENDSEFTNGKHSITVTYEEVSDLDIKLKYTGADGIEHEMSLLEGEDGHVDYYAGEVTINFDFLKGEYSYINKDGEEKVLSLEYYGYGNYFIDTTGIGWNSAKDSDYTSFLLTPIKGGIEREEVDGEYKYYLDIEDDDDGTGESVVKEVVVRIYDEDGNEVPFSPITVDPSDDRIELPFSDYGLEDGTYRIEIYAYGEDGLLYDNPYVIMLDYVAKVPQTPDTGGIFQNLNISKTDYLITGLMIFGLVAVCGVVFIMKNDKKKVSRKQACKRRK